MSETRTSGAGVSLRNLVKQYGSAAAVDHIELDIVPGEFLTLLGPSGSGKTTTLSMIAGFTEPTSGSVICDGAEITHIPPHKRGLGMVFQNYSLFPHMSVQQNVEFPLRQRGMPKALRAEKARAALDLVELGARATAKPTELSGGQQQRVALARALVFEPRLLLMDEPFGALDRALRERLQIEVRRLHRELGLTVVFVTHDQEEALTMSDRIAVFNEGKIEQVGTPQELYREPATLFVSRFIGESNALNGVSTGTSFDTEGGAVLPAQLPFQGAGQCIIRPESLRITQQPHSAPETHTFAGTLTDHTYLGAQNRLEVTTPDGVIVVRTTAATELPPLGGSVLLSVDTAELKFFSLPALTEKASR